MDVTIYNADLIQSPSGAQWVLSMEVEGVDGISGHIIPVEAFENTAAEYGLDPSNFDQLLEIIVYRAYIPGDLLGPRNPKWLFNAESIDEARENLLEMVADTKGTGTLTSVSGQSPQQALQEQVPRLNRSAKADPIAFMKKHTPIDQSVMEVRRQVTQRHRDKIRSDRKRRSAGGVPSTEERLAAVLAELDTGTQGMTNDHPRRKNPNG